MLLNNEIDPKRANAILYGCNVCLSAIRVDDQQAQQMALALPAVAQDEDAAVGSPSRAPVEVDDNIAAVLVPSQQEATGICFA